MKQILFKRSADGQKNRKIKILDILRQQINMRLHLTYQGDCQDNDKTKCDVIPGSRSRKIVQLQG